MNTELTPVAVAWDAWRTERGGSPQITRRQRERLDQLVDYARAHSPLYAERYRGLPAHVAALEQLPPVTKPELMHRFDDWVTDSEVHRSDLQQWIGDLSHLGHDYLDKYLVCTTSGSSGSPAILVLDHRELAVMNGLGYARALSNLLSRRIV